MTPDLLGAQLASAPVPNSDAARDATVVAARAALPSRSASPGEGDASPIAGGVRSGQPASARRPRRWRRLAAGGWRIALAGAVAVVAVALVTPPGRAALGDAAELIGQIGGAPASDGDEGLESTIPPGRAGSPTVVDNGTAPDGSRYEWVAYRRQEGLPPGVAPRVKRRTLDTFCVRFAWADAPRRKSTGGCGSLGGTSPGVIQMTSRPIRPATPGGARDFMLIGRVDPRVGRLRMIYRRPGGVRHELPVDLARVQGELLRRAGGDKPLTVFTAFIPGDLVRADRLDARYRLMSLGVVDPTFPMPLPYGDAYKRCVRRHGGFYERGWIDVTIYDRRDRRVATLQTRTSRPAPAACDSLRKMPANRTIRPEPMDKTPTRARLLRAFPPEHPVVPVR